MVPVNGPSSGVVTLSAKDDRGECSAYVSFGNGGENMDAPSYEYPGGAGAKTVYTIELSSGTSVLQRFLVAQSNPDTTATGWCRPSEGVAIGSFFCPFWTRGGDADVYFGYWNGQIEVSPAEMWFEGGATSHYVHEAISGDGWVWPYHGTTICAGNRCKLGIDAGVGSKLVIMPVDTLFVLGADVTKSISVPIQLPAAGRYGWVEDWLTLDFSPSAGLTVESDSFSVRGMTFTTSDLTSGWGGLDFLAGSAGTLDKVTIRRAGNPATGAVAGVRVYNATVSIFGGLIEEGQGTASGVRVIGDQGLVTVDGTEIRLMPHNGILATGFGTAKIFNARIQQNQASGITATTSATVHVGSPTVGARDAMVNDLTGNGTWGVLVASGATVTHAKAGAVGQRGYNYVVGNQLGGAGASTGALQNAGSSSVYASYNWLDLNGQGGADAVSRSTGTVTYATYDWWGHPTAPPDTFAYHGTSQEAYLTVDPKLTGPPAAAPGAAPLAAPPPEPAEVPGDAFTTAASLVLRGDGARGVGLLAGTVTRRPGTTDAATALALTGALASDAERDRETRSAALTLLLRESRGRRAAHRAWARRGLMRAYGRAGDQGRMMAEAQAMLDDEPDDVSAFIAQLALAYGHAVVGEAAEAWAAWDAAAALGASREVADETSVEAAREDLVALVGERPPVARLAGAAASITSTETPGAGGLQAPYPNPAGPGIVTIPFSLAERSPVRIEVVDVLGREVAVLADGVREAGSYTAPLDSRRLAPGSYMIRLLAGDTATYTQILTVAR